MSYIRAGHPLRYFKGESELYVFPDNDGFIEDYESEYNDNASFAELLLNISRRTFKVDNIMDEEQERYINKLADVLAKKLNLERKTDKEFWEEVTKPICHECFKFAKIKHGIFHYCSEECIKKHEE